VVGEPHPLQAIRNFREAITDKDIARNVDTFLKADKLGRPTLYYIDNRAMSLNITRYMNSISILKKEFTSLDGMKIFEIGAGYGGLLHCIKTQWNPASYNIQDLPPVMELAQKHSKLLGHEVNLGQPDEEVDLAIAEYSITEMNEPTLTDMTTNYLFPAKRIFVRCNVVDKAVRNNWYDMLRTNFDIIVMREVPDIVQYNSIVVGRSK
jgi:putative sugar O-methyltransferase